jgi:hypothetical protein
MIASTVKKRKRITTAPQTPTKRIPGLENLFQISGQRIRSKMHEKLHEIKIVKSK